MFELLVWKTCASVLSKGMEHGGTVVFAKKARAPANQLFVYSSCHEGDAAGQMAGVMSFEVPEQIHRTLVWSLLEEPLDAMCSRSSLEHLRVTDKLTRTQLATSARKSSGPCVGSRHTPVDALAAVFRKQALATKLKPLPT